MHSPKEPVEPQTPVKGVQRASSRDSTHREDLRPGLGTFRRAFSLVSQRASSRASDSWRSSRFLFRSLRRSLDDRPAAPRPAADECQATAVPEAGHGPEVPSRVTDGISRQSSTRVEPEALEPEAGEGFTNNTKHGRKLRPEGRTMEPRFATGSPPSSLHPSSCTIAF